MIVASSMTGDTTPIWLIALLALAAWTLFVVVVARDVIGRRRALRRAARQAAVQDWKRRGLMAEDRS